MHPPSLLILNARLFTPTAEWLVGWLLVEGRRIANLGPGDPPEFEPGRIGREIDAGGWMLLPGFIDLHVHGALGYEAMDGSPQALREMAGYYARHGTTAFLAATWAAPRAPILGALHGIAEAVGPIAGGATLLGTYLEGPYLNPARCGAQDPLLIRRADPAEALEFLDGGPVKLLALAPEYPENLWLIDECVRRGITVSAAHTAAGLAEMTLAVKHGLRQTTHTYNGMTGLGHRELGTVGAAMALTEINCEMICDNIHVHPAAQKILIDVKTPSRVILVTDAIRGAGLPDGEYPIDNRTVTIRNGEVRLPGGSLAGSVLTMERALFNAWQASQRPLQEIWPMSSLNAARSIGVAAQKGSIEVGKDADLALLDDDFTVWMTIAEGEIVYAKEG